VDAMNDGEMEGMQTFDKEIEKMIRGGIVKREIALAYSTNANNLALAISDLDGGPPPGTETANRPEASEPNVAIE
jgi:Tfp pilus assembly ATPase PilU